MCNLVAKSIETTLKISKHPDIVTQHNDIATSTNPTKGCSRDHNWAQNITLTMKDRYDDNMAMSVPNHILRCYLHACYA